MTDKAELRKKMAEQVSRRICNYNYGIDPDTMVYTGQPQHLHNFGGMGIGIVIPDKSFQKPAWQLFYNDVMLVIETLEKEY